MDKYIGLDMDSNKTVACVLQSGKKDVFRTIGPDIASLRAFLLEQQKDGSRTHAVFEISGMAGFIYDSIADCCTSVTVANPSKMTWIYRTARKTDRIDSRKMAVLLSIGEIPAVHMPSQEVRQWRQCILHRRNIVGRITSTKNRIKSLLKGKGYVKAGHLGSWWKKTNRLWMRELVCEDAMWCMALVNMLDELEMHEVQLDRVTDGLDKYLAKKPGAKLLMSIPGIGPRTAEAILAYTDDISRFKTSRKYRSYFGLVPKIDQSGSTVRMGHISKQGPSVVRWLLCESCWKAIYKSKAFREFFDRVCNGDSRRRKIAMVAVCRKMVCVMRAMLITGEFYNEKLAAGVCNDASEAA
jgi:transposase